MSKTQVLNLTHFIKLSLLLKIPIFNDLNVLIKSNVVKNLSPKQKS